MKLRVYSDLHLEFRHAWRKIPKDPEADLVVLAGDISIGAGGISWAARTFPDTPVVYILGNHEYYGGHFDTLAAECRARAKGTNVHVLEKGVFDIGGIRVLGCSLWNDYALLGEHRVPDASAWAKSHLADFLQVFLSSGKALEPEDVVRRYRDHVAWLDQEITRSDRPTLVVTHHAPTATMVNPIYANSISNASFHSNADHLIRGPVRMWIYGHTHFNVDFVHQNVRIVTNQCGYPLEDVDKFTTDGLILFDESRL